MVRYSMSKGRTCPARGLFCAVNKIKQTAFFCLTGEFKRSLAAIILVWALANFSAHCQVVSPSFKDVSSEVGLNPVLANKYWSPTIADFNRDGYYDLILANHGGGKQIDGGSTFYSPEMYWGSTTGFIPFQNRSQDAIPTQGTDYHGFSAGYFGNKDDYPDLILTLGGANGGRGNLPVTVEFTGGQDQYIVRKDLNRKDELVDPSLLEIGIDGFGRGRSCFFIDMDQDGDLDLVYNNIGPDAEADGINITDSKFIYEWKDDKFNRVADIGALKDCVYELSAIADINHDNFLDLIYFGGDPMQCWISQGAGFDFELNNTFLPQDIDRVRAIAEIDYDGDGDFDLYLARSAYKSGEDDILLEWDEVNNKYIDVSNAASLPKGGMHMGLSVGDFDNNGYQDVFLCRATFDDADSRLADLILMNRGDKTFMSVVNHGATVIVEGGDGDQNEVFDYNKDGKLDVLSGTKEGLWRMFENTTENPEGNFVSLQIGRSLSDERHVPLGASVTVVANKGDEILKVMRRINSQGQSHAQSFLDMMHFGLGDFDTVSEIIVNYGTHKETLSYVDGLDVINQSYSVGAFAGTTVDPLKIETLNASSRELIFYPNPGENSIRLSVSDPISWVTISNIDGKELMRIDNPPLHTIDISSLPVGTYVIRALTDQLLQGKLIKSDNKL